MEAGKTLVIGSLGHAHATCVSWAQALTVNLVDFDRVVLNCRALTPEYLSSVDLDYFSKLRKAFCRLIESDGVVIAIGTATRYGKTLQFRASDDTYSWSPVDIATHEESGDTIDIRRGDFSSYLAKLNRWEYWYAVPKGCLTRELTEFFGSTATSKYKIDTDMIATNRYDKALAMVVNTRIQYERSSEWVTLGPIVVLPDIPELETREAVNLVLEDLLGLPQTALPPEWAPQVAVPGIAGYEGEIQRYKGEIQNLEAKIDATEELKAEREWYKKLLYASGPELEQVFSHCLGKLGATIGPSQYSQEEFVFDFEGQRCLVECKGISKSAARAHVNQLTTYVDQYHETEGATAKGVLFVNPWRNHPPPLRGREDTPIFPENVVVRATQLEFALVSSLEFFDAFCKFLDGRLDGAAILRQIVAATGVTTFS